MAHYCLFNDDLKFAFCVDPKCGSTSVIYWFGSIIRKHEPKKPFRVERYMRRALKIDSFDDYFKVWFVRDPLDRLVGFYNKFIVPNNDLWNHADFKKEISVENYSFEEFIHTLHDVTNKGGEPQHHLRVQSRILNSSKVDLIINIDDLDQKSEAIMKHINTDVKPSHQNQRPTTRIKVDNAYRLKPKELLKLDPIDSDCFWNDELRSIANKIYSEDNKVIQSL